MSKYEKIDSIFEKWRIFNSKKYSVELKKSLKKVKKKMVHGEK